jgi:hypothetical protein
VIKLIGSALSFLTDGACAFDDYYLDTMALRDIDFTSSFGLNEVLEGFLADDDDGKHAYFADVNNNGV